MFVFYRCINILFLIFKYRLFFLIGFIPYLGIFKLFLKPNSKKQAMKFKDFLEEMGPCFIKLGQILSVRSDLIGKNFANYLSYLREHGKRSNKQVIRRMIIDNFKSNNFLEFLNLPKDFCFSEEYLTEDNLKLEAVGSISEVYKLKLCDTVLAVKVLKPYIRNKFRKDICFLKKVFEIAQRNIKEANRSKILKIVELLEHISNFELDLKFEAASFSEVRDNFKNYSNLYIPKIYWNLCCKDMLVTEWIEGYKIYDLVNLEINHIDKILILKNILTIFFLQVLKYGFFHGDLHPGNIIILKDNRVALLDFGIMGRTSLTMRKYVYDIWKAFLNQDYKKAAKTHFEAGWISDKYNEGDLALAIRSIVDPVFLTDEISFSVGTFMEHLFNITRIFGMEIQKDLLLIQKNLLLLEGIARDLLPHNNVWILAKEIINQNEFKITLEEKTIYTKFYLENKIYDYVHHIAKVFTKDYNSEFNISYNKKNIEHILRQYKYVNIIIILLLIVVIILLWKY